MQPLLEDIIRQLKDAKKISIWTGAGSSYASGIPYVKDIITEFIYVLSDNSSFAEAYYASYRNANLPFEVFMQLIITLSEDDQCLEMFALGKPTYQHRFIAELCKTGKMTDIFTTNFDTLIEQAIQQISPDTEYEVLSDEGVFKAFLEKGYGEKLRLFKVHGTIDQKNTIRTSIDTIAKRDWMAERRNIIQRAFSGTNSAFLIVVGYSFSDVFDITPAIEAITDARSKQLLVIVHNEGLTRPKISAIQEKINSKIDLQKFQGYYIEIDTSEFFRCLASEMGLSLGKEKQRVTAWKNKIKQWEDRLLPSKKEFILTQLLNRVQQNIDALIWNNKALQKATASNYTISVIDILLQRVSILHQGGDHEVIETAWQHVKHALSLSITTRYYSGLSRAIDLSAHIILHNHDNTHRAIRWYRAGLKIKERIEDQQGQAMALLSIANCLRRLQQHENAIEHYKMSIDIRNDLGDVLGISKCYHGIGNCHLELQQFDKAIEAYQQFEYLSGLVGDQWTNSAANYQLATLYLQMDDYENAIKACDKSLEIRSHTKGREFLNCIYTKGKILYAMGQTEEGKRLQMQSYQARSVNPDTSDYADSMFDLGKIAFDERDYKAALKMIENALIIYLAKQYTIKLVEITRFLLRSSSEHEACRSQIMDLMNKYDLKIS